MSTPASSGSGLLTRARSSPAAPRALAAALLAAVLVAGCGDGGDEAAALPEADKSGEVVDISGTEPVGEVTAGSVASLAECRDWNEATPEQKLATIADVRGQLNPAGSGVEAPVLSDDEALRLFDSACAADYAGGFRLYKLYANAVGFIPLARELEEARAEGAQP
jgi:hypothetical protein